MEQFHTWANLFPEPLLLVQVDGLVLALNQAATHQLASSRIRPDTAIFPFVFAETREQVRDYLRLCSRTKSFLPGLLTFFQADNVQVSFRAEGALYARREGDTPAQVLLRLVSKQAAESRFAALNQQIDKLSKEIDQRRRIELDLFEQRERFRVTLQSIGDGVIATDTKGNVTFLNAVAEGYTGWSRAEAIGKPIDEIFRIVDEETFAPVDNPVIRVLAEGVIVGLANHTVLIRKNGTLLHIDDSGAPIRDTDGVLTGAVLVFHDITARRQLEQQVDSRNRQLEEEHKRKDEFLAMLGHELRNPLAPMKAAVQLHSFPNVGEEARKQAMEIMNRQLDHLTVLVDQLLDVARITSGRVSLTRERVGVTSIVDRSLELCDPLFRQKQQIVSAEFLSEPLYVQGDITRLTQVLSNILNNASKYTQPLGKIHIAVQRRNGYVEIVIRDNGMGIHPVLLPRVFDVFSQAERTLARSEGGLGVGLTVVRRLVELHEGTVTVSSEGIDKGSEFRIVLPLDEASAVAKQSSSPPPKVNRGLKILIVDDNQDAAAMLTALLSITGYEVVTAYDGTQAMAVAEQVHPDIIFLDIGLPGLDGYEVARNIRSRTELSGARLIAVTGYGQQEDIRKAQAAGFDEHLVKPVDYSRIMKVLNGFSSKQG